ncbi:M56 family metallopeptidase [Flavobacterium sp. ZT3R18]|uniref:M56 family metallopeptidase n=1 Tax=Flavobacterium sp. ZT3R18 TaxID=2594429 RepID=UPI00117B62CE|nr:M56 family metallopeptidase [Flavobacterium sp. ZT3R18]TRX32222.1 M56 family metallopeptidase [Flavobacterium sp. ZT3R18]
METLFIYIAKSSGLIGMFYIAYYLLLRKETFFTANRWFLLAGLLTSVILPWVVFTTIVWVEPTPTHFDWSKIPDRTPIQKENFEINWYLVLGVAYVVGIALFLIQFVFDFYSLNRVLKGKTIQQQADHKFIDLKENIAPFSYFNTIVYNSSLYSEAELEGILEHEKVHSDQNHTVDVLITRFFCTLFWFNPFIWLYKKAILQNLEFIADSEATKNISDKKAYQLTLLKITTHENCVVLTNHFYQSLIKKRIVMLNKNQSKKWNSWKYALVLPVLVAFVFLFQMEVIAQEKAIIKKEIKDNPTDPESEDIYQIDKTTTDAELQEKAKILSEKYAIKTTFSKIKRNANNELISIKIKLQKGKEIATEMEVNSSEPLKDFGIAISKNKNGTTNIGIVTDKGESSPSNELGYNSDELTPPTPPTPPNHPYENLMDAPTPPDYPDAPELPSNFNNKKAMAKYNKAMDQFNQKMKIIEPKMDAFNKEMDQFNAEMKKLDPALKNYDKEMKVFDQEMKIFEKEMAAYEKEIEQ